MLLLMNTPFCDDYNGASPYAPDEASTAMVLYVPNNDGASPHVPHDDKNDDDDADWGWLSPSIMVCEQREPLSAASANDENSESSDDDSSVSNLDSPLLSYDEAEAIKAYTRCSKKVNGALRNARNQVIPEAVQKQIDSINSGLGKFPSFVGTTFRGCGEDVKDYFDLSPGQIFCDSAFLSTTKEEEMTENFGGAFYTFVITCKQKGKYISDYDCFDGEDESEEEVLFPPETRFLITKVEEFTIWMTEEVVEKEVQQQQQQQEPLLVLMNTPYWISEEIVEKEEPMLLLMNTPFFDEYNSALPLGSQAVVDPPAPSVPADLSMANSFSELGSQWIDGRRRSARLQPQLGSVFVKGLRRSARLL